MQNLRHSITGTDTFLTQIVHEQVKAAIRVGQMNLLETVSLLRHAF
jgi:hypothetical protein